MLVVFLTLISIFYAYHKNPQVGTASAVYVFLVLIIHSLFYYEVIALDLDYFISDELAYIDFDDAYGLNESAKKDRILWFYYQSILTSSFSADGLFNKLASLPFLPLLLLLINKICEKSTFSIFVFLFCPYLLFLMQTALRDVAILYVTILIVFYWCNVDSKRGRFFFQLSLLIITLFFLRPFAVFIVVFSIYLYELLLSLKNKHLRHSFLIVFINLIVGLLVSSVFYVLFKDRIDQYIRTLVYFNENGLWLDESKSAVEPSLTLRYFSYAIIRYISTPLPFSLIERFLSEDVTQFGYLDDIVRFLNQLSYFFLLGCFLFKLIITKLKFVKGWSSTIWVLFIVTMINSIVYALYYAGGGHSRIKILLFIFVFIAFNSLFIKGRGSYHWN